MFLTLCLFAGFVLIGCKKNSGPSKTKMELLTQLNWKMIAAGADLDENNQVDAGFDFLEDCQKDNILTFNTNGTGTAVEGADVCDGEDATSTFLWSFQNNETVVHIEIDEIGDVTITSLTDSELKAYKMIDVGGGIMKRGLFVLKHP